MMWSVHPEQPTSYVIFTEATPLSLLIKKPLLLSPTQHSFLLYLSLYGFCVEMPEDGPCTDRNM
jgi:hypothetical protein